MRLVKMLVTAVVLYMFVTPIFSMITKSTDDIKMVCTTCIQGIVLNIQEIENAQEVTEIFIHNALTINVYAIVGQYRSKIAFFKQCLDQINSLNKLKKLLLDDLIEGAYTQLDRLSEKVTQLEKAQQPTYISIKQSEEDDNDDDDDDDGSTPLLEDDDRLFEVLRPLFQSLCCCRKNKICTSPTSE